jgi:hypothetical protein
MRLYGQYFSRQVRPAIGLVMQGFPELAANPDVVCKQALDAIRDEAIRQEAAPIIGLLARLSPRRYGVPRRRKYWRLIFSVLSDETDRHMVVDWYLCQFPSSVTDSQYDEMRRYLMRHFGLDQEDAELRLANFSIRENSHSHDGVMAW